MLRRGLYRWLIRGIFVKASVDRARYIIVINKDHIAGTPIRYISCVLLPSSSDEKQPDGYITGLATLRDGLPLVRALAGSPALQ
jgi:hypothetical protein